MRLHSVLAAAVLVGIFSVSPVSGQENPQSGPRYKFKKGDVLKYELESSLECSQVGTHPAFLSNGNDRPLTWVMNGQFENVVVETAEDGSAKLERRVRSIESTGDVQGAKFKFSWDREKSKEVLDDTKESDLMNKFVVTMIQKPLQFIVDTEGRTRVEPSELGRLVMRRGMMYWPIEDKPTWTSVEEIALPVLHDKIKIEFKNTVTQDATRTGFKVRLINAVAGLKESAAAGFHNFDGMTFKVSGTAKPEFDLTNGRMRRLEIDLRIEFAGKGQVPDGSDGDIRGVATYKETQVYKD